MELSISNKLFRNIKNNRWQHEFSEREKIGAGGFASVYKATNCFDDHTYAVKKIKLQFKDIRRNFEQELQKVLDEAKFLAKLKHENILRYYGSWLEATTKPNRVGKRSLALRPSIFKKQKENHNFLNIDTFCESDQDNTPTPEIGSPLVVFGESDKQDEEEVKPIVKKETFFPQKPSKFCGRLGHHMEEVGLKIQTKLREVASEPEECITPLVRGEKLENILLFIQTELCSDTLETYIDARNELLLQLKKQSEEEYQKRRKEYLREALVYAKQILNGLAHIHSHCVVHRDLKPSNIFIANKVCKIGDFGLVKQLVSFYPVENSPLSGKEVKVIDSVGDSFQLETVSTNLATESKNSSSDNSFDKEKEFHSDNEARITKNTGTRMYASPEQWMADKDTFDYRADIFSLGVTFLLLFHPMSTYMERTNIIKESKEGKIPESLEKELPEIAEIIKKMLSLEPCARPSIEKILQSLKLPCAIKSQLSGAISFRKENAQRWRKKYFKVIDNNLHVYSREHDKKAENIFTLSQWKMTMEGKTNNFTREATTTKINSEEREPNNSASNKTDKTEAFLRFENPDQLGCEIKPENQTTIEELFKSLESCTV